VVTTPAESLANRLEALREALIVGELSGYPKAFDFSAFLSRCAARSP
jgi:Arc/MetJ-type ribon-helix-helix transcriptional regulator